MNGLFADADPDLVGWYSPLVHDYRMSNNQEYWWCDHKGNWTTDAPEIKDIKTPLQMLKSDL